MTLKQEIAEAATVHAKLVYERESDSHSEISEHGGFIKGAEWAAP